MGFGLHQLAVPRGRQAQPCRASYPPATTATTRKSRHRWADNGVHTYYSYIYALYIFIQISWAVRVLYSTVYTHLVFLRNHHTLNYEAMSSNHNRLCVNLSGEVVPKQKPRGRPITSKNIHAYSEKQNLNYSSNTASYLWFCQKKLHLHTSHR
jgi:hypothetical protein